MGVQSCLQPVDEVDSTILETCQPQVLVIGSKNSEVEKVGFEAVVAIQLYSFTACKLL
jgi:hypothetical protein